VITVEFKWLVPHGVPRGIGQHKLCESLVWFLLIDETLSANLVSLSDYEKG